MITPAHDVAPFVGEAVRSVLAQSHEAIEYLVIDDGSTDATAEEVRRAASGDTRVRLESIPHAGSSAARNRGLELASGQYVAFLDGDDRWHPRFLEENLALLESLPSNVAAVFCRPRVISEQGRPYLLRWERAGAYDFDGMLVGACPPKCGSSLLLRASAFEGTDGFSLSLASAVDLDMWLRIQSKAGSEVFWANPSYLIDQRIRAGAVSRDHAKRFAALDTILRTHGPTMKRLPVAAAYVRPSVFAFRAGDDETAERWANHARRAGIRYLVTNLFGLRLIGWLILGASGRKLLRSSSARVRRIVGPILGNSGPLGR